MTSLTIIPNVSLAELTTFRVGGLARWFVRVSGVEQVSAAVSWARERRLPSLFLGEGSNVLFSDDGFPGLVIKNRFLGVKISGEEVEVAGGESLPGLIRRMNRLGLAGLERMYGIPGSVAGAIVGNAGAYGQEIKDVVAEVAALCPEGVRTFSADEARFGYRRSVFKERRECFVLSCRLRLRRTNADLQRESDEILAQRQTKYPAGLRCPGSFFKNVIAATLPPEALAGVPAEFIHYGKIPAGRLLEAVGARGAARGDAMIADYHGNLLINRRLASSRDILALANEYAERVWKAFRIRLEPEILVVPDHASQGQGSEEQKP
jgi:UDP-N-acetylmuramate dehydrogenase